MKQSELHIKCEVAGVRELTAFFVNYCPPRRGESIYWLPTWSPKGKAS